MKGRHSAKHIATVFLDLAKGGSVPAYSARAFCCAGHKKYLQDLAIINSRVCSALWLQRFEQRQLLIAQSKLQYLPLRMDDDVRKNYSIIYLSNRF